MALEDLTGPSKFITALVAGNPVSADDRREGDDHIRGVKNVLRNTFPLLDGAVSFNAADMTAALTGGPFLPLKGGMLNSGTAATNLTIQTTAQGLGAEIVLNAPPVSGTNIISKRNGKTRWLLALGEATTEPGGNVGTDLVAAAFADDGVTRLRDQLRFTRSDGAIAFGGTVQCKTIARINSATNAQVDAIADSAPVNNKVCSMLMYANGDIRIGGFNDVGSHLRGLMLPVGTTDLLSVGQVGATTGYKSKAGSGGGFGANLWNFHWSGSALQCWIDNVNNGNVSLTCDERVKKNILPLVFDAMKFAQVQPIKFRFANVGLFKDDGKDHWGFSAQNLVTVYPPAVIGDVQAVDEDGAAQPASPDLAAVLAQTVLAVQEALQRIAALEIAYGVGAR